MKKSLFAVLLTLAVLLLLCLAQASGQSTLSVGDRRGGPCTTDNDCHNNGDCLPLSEAEEEDHQEQAPDQPTELQGICWCHERYAGAHCEHKRRNKLTAFLLSIFLGGLGADRFYLGYLGLGVMKLLFNLFACLPACVASWCFVWLNRRERYVAIGDDGTSTVEFEDYTLPTRAYLCWSAGNCASCCLALGALAWWLTDWILILKGVLGDANGHDLYNNM